MTCKAVVLIEEGMHSAIWALKIPTIPQEWLLLHRGAFSRYVSRAAGCSLTLLQPRALRCHRQWTHAAWMHQLSSPTPSVLKIVNDVMGWWNQAGVCRQQVPDVGDVVCCCSVVQIWPTSSQKHLEDQPESYFSWLHLVLADVKEAQDIPNACCSVEQY